jgi:hypothetical protein
MRSQFYDISWGTKDPYLFFIFSIIAGSLFLLVNPCQLWQREEIRTHQSEKIPNVIPKLTPEVTPGLAIQ